MTILKEKGFCEEEIRKAYEYIDKLKELDKSKGVAKNQQNTIKKMIQTKSIYTYILKETLQLLIEKWQLGNRGKIMQENIKVYLAVCKEYHKKCKEVLT